VDVVSADRSQVIADLKDALNDLEDGYWPAELVAVLQRAIELLEGGEAHQHDWQLSESKANQFTCDCGATWEPRGFQP